MSSGNAKIGQPAPKINATAVFDYDFFENFSLDQYQEQGKWVVLFFYPLDFTFVCPTEIIAFSDKAKDFEKINCQLVGCSTDSHFTHLAWIEKPRKEGGLGKIEIPLISDCNHKISKDYGVLHEDLGFTYRGLFIIDGKGNVRQITINDMPVGRSVDEALRLVQALQFVEEHGEMCPVNWKPGDEAIKG